MAAFQSSRGQSSPVDVSSLAPFLDGRRFDDVLQQYDEDGYVIFENVVSEETCRNAHKALEPYLNQDLRGRNDFEGVWSNRVYALLAKGEIFAELAIHPLALAFAERDLGLSCLLSANLAINLHPGETAQPWHTDDSHCEAPRPRQPFGVSTFWAIDAMTEDNGATEVIPGSHRWGAETPTGDMLKDAFQTKTLEAGDGDPGFHPDAVKAVMPAGSLMVAKGTLWHRGGANNSQSSRLLVTPQYCAGFIRPLETMTLAVPPEKAAALPPRAQALLGYSIHPPFMGYVDGMHPARALS